MKLQYTTDCALLMMVCLTGKNQIVSSRELEKAIRFPQQTIFNAGRRLKKAGLISTVSGPFGGYTLAKPPESITIQEVLLAFKDTFEINELFSPKKASAATLHNFSKLLTNVKIEIERKMSAFTLADLLEETEFSETA